MGLPDSAVAAWQGLAADAGLRRWVMARALLAPNPRKLQHRLQAHRHRAAADRKTRRCGRAVVAAEPADQRLPMSGSVWVCSV